MVQSWDCSGVMPPFPGSPSHPSAPSSHREPPASGLLRAPFLHPLPRSQRSSLPRACPAAWWGRPQVSCPPGTPGLSHLHIHILVQDNCLLFSSQIDRGPAIGQGSCQTQLGGRQETVSSHLPFGRPAHPASCLGPPIVCRQTAARRQQASLVARLQRQAHAPQRRTGTDDRLGEDVHTHPEPGEPRVPGRQTPIAGQGRHVPWVCVYTYPTIVCSSTDRQQGRGRGMRAHPAQARERYTLPRGGGG